MAVQRSGAIYVLDNQSLISKAATIRGRNRKSVPVKKSPPAWPHANTGLLLNVSKQPWKAAKCDKTQPPIEEPSTTDKPGCYLT